MGERGFGRQFSATSDRSELVDVHRGGAEDVVPGRLLLHRAVEWEPDTGDGGDHDED